MRTGNAVIDGPWTGAAGMYRALVVEHYRDNVISGRVGGTFDGDSVFIYAPGAQSAALGLQVFEVFWHHLESPLSSSEHLFYYTTKHLNFVLEFRKIVLIFSLKT
jgi:hypothetical protein